MKSVLITGFAPFGPIETNPSESVLSLLPSSISGRVVQRRVLPVETDQIEDVLLPLLSAARWDLVLLVGVALERPTITVERIALNLLDFDRPDNDGKLVLDEPIIETEDAPLALRSRLPFDQIMTRWKEAGIEGKVSNHAGAYLCNQALYLALRHLPSQLPCGFVHMAMPDKMPLDEQARAIQVLVETSLAA